MRLHCKLWKETGHNFNKLRDLLIPDKTEMRMSDIIALTKAATLKEVCLHDVDRGLQLIEGIEVSFAPINLSKLLAFITWIAPLRTLKQYSLTDAM